MVRQVYCTSASSPGIRIQHQVSKPPKKPRTLALASAALPPAREAAASADPPVPRSKQVCCMFSIPAMRIQHQASKRRRPCTDSVASVRSSVDLPCAPFGKHAGHGWTQPHTCSTIWGVPIKPLKQVTLIDVPETLALGAPSPARSWLKQVTLI